jgi:uncharacterized protein YdiU (UPF0061 family)
MNFGLFNFDNSYKKLPEIFFSRILPTPVSTPSMIVFNEKLAKNLDLNFQAFSRDELAEIFSGNILEDGAEPIAQAYAGHQYGNFVILGDGRAILLGEHLTKDKKRFDIQLKGAGQTPYSRRGDGRAALAPMLREYLISEAMFALNIPTTRSLAVVATGENVYRESELPGAILTRIASSHIRVGTFQFLAASNRIDDLEKLINYTIKRHFSAAKNAHDLLKSVISAQVDLIINWLRVGFVHGVMNTDNMSICGETIDYGPCAFIDEYDPQKTFSSIDFYGRYAFENQPIIAQWNLARFAETLLPFLSREIAEEEIDNFRVIYQKKYLNMMRSKLGIVGEEAGDEKIISDFLNLMQREKMDYTNTFRELLAGKIFDQNLHNRRIKNQSLIESNALMKKTNPVIIPRNHKVEEALRSAVSGDMEKFNNLLNALRNPYQEADDKKPFQSPPLESEKITKTFCGT